MFRKCQSFVPASFSSVMVAQVTNKDDKIVIEEKRARDVKPLPDASLFDLSSMLDAGVDLRRVSVTIPSKSIDLEKLAKKNASSKSAQKSQQSNKEVE